MNWLKDVLVGIVLLLLFWWPRKRLRGSEHTEPHR